MYCRKVNKKIEKLAILESSLSYNQIQIGVISIKIKKCGPWGGLSQTWETESRGEGTLSGIPISGRAHSSFPNHFRHHILLSQRE